MRFELRVGNRADLVFRQVQAGAVGLRPCGRCLAEREDHALRAGLRVSVPPLSRRPLAQREEEEKQERGGKREHRVGKQGLTEIGDRFIERVFLDHGARPL